MGKHAGHDGPVVIHDLFVFIHGGIKNTQTTQAAFHRHGANYRQHSISPEGKISVAMLPNDVFHPPADWP
jgi:hypothetical protein